MKRNYKKVSCHSSKTEAKKEQKKLHDKGMTAQVKQDPKTKKYCIHSAGKKK